MRELVFDLVKGLLQQEEIEQTLGFRRRLWPKPRVGPERVLYGSDYPFTIGDMKGILARVDSLPHTQRDAIRSSNAERLFDLT